MINPVGGKDAYSLAFVGVYEKSPFNLSVYQKMLVAVADNEDEIIGICERARHKLFPPSKWKFSSYALYKISDIGWISRLDVNSLKPVDVEGE